MYLVLAAPGHDDVGVRHGGRDVVVEGRLHMAGILWTKIMRVMKHVILSLCNFSVPVQGPMPGPYPCV